MEYLLLIYGSEAKMQAPDPGRTAAYVAYTQALKQAGALRGGNRLQPVSAATTVRMQEGKTSVLDGPFAETKEQLGGYYLIDVPDLDAALAWAARCPAAAQGAVEVRPLWTP